jgi:hypothetical protein
MVALQKLAVVVPSATELASPTIRYAVRVCDRCHNLNKASPHYGRSLLLLHIEGLISLDEDNSLFLGGAD